MTVGTGVKRGAIADVPAEILDRARLLRAQGMSPAKIWKAIPELAQTINLEQLKSWIYQGSAALGDVATPPADIAASLGKVAALLERSGIDPDAIGKVDSVTFSEWDAMYAEVVSCETCHGTGGEPDAPCPDCEGRQTRRVARKVPMTGARVVLHPTWADGPQWPVVQPAKPTIVKPGAAKSRQRLMDVAKGYKVAVILPDVQFGFRRDLRTGILDPFHDVAALEGALEIIRITRPDLVILLGDFLDLAEFSRFDQEPEFANTTQESFDAGHLYLARIRAEVPDAEIRYLEGNHDRRIQKAILTNAKAALRLRPAATPPSTWPSVSIPAYMRLDDLGVEYLGGYPANMTWINERVCCVHGEKVRSSGSTAAAVVDDERVSVIFGHVHRIEKKYKTRRTFAGPRFSFAATPGCLSRVDGAVPSTKGSNDPLGNPISRPEDWQQGCAVVTYIEGDGPFGYEQVFINGADTLFRGVPVLGAAA